MEFDKHIIKQELQPCDMSRKSIAVAVFLFAISLKFFGQSSRSTHSEEEYCSGTHPF